MKKIICLLLVTIFFLSGCSFLSKNRDVNLNVEGSINPLRFDEYADARNKIDIILNCIKTKDDSLLRSMMAPKALEDTDIESGFSALKKIGDESVTRHYFDEQVSLSGNYGNPKTTVLTRYDFYLHTSENIYCFYILDYPIDENVPENQGIFKIEFDTKETSWEYWQDRLERPGIFDTF